MKKIFKIIAPNGEFIKWGEFDDKEHVITLEVEKYYETGLLAEKESIDVILPEELDIRTKWRVLSSYRHNGMLMGDKPNQHDDEIADESEDNRKILND